MVRQAAARNDATIGTKGQVEQNENDQDHDDNRERQQQRHVRERRGRGSGIRPCSRTRARSPPPPRTRCRTAPCWLHLRASITWGTSEDESVETTSASSDLFFRRWTCTPVGPQTVPSRTTTAIGVTPAAAPTPEPSPPAPAWPSPALPVPEAAAEAEAVPRDRDHHSVAHRDRLADHVLRRDQPLEFRDGDAYHLFSSHEWTSTSRCSAHIKRFCGDSMEIDIV